ncbi:MAG: hypothetical protein KZQ73_09105 [Candidatus Thiodiazotropha sp. (ex Semelilucina semeliformis)]|nr:hypothetical protein [Candidatus Thiodiazotropha sp. (ex Semelilucina semeliformis)]
MTVSVGLASLESERRARIPEPIRHDGKFEYTHHLTQNCAEFRGNEEVMSEFFNPDSCLVTIEIDALHDGISLLFLSSAFNLRFLDKTY